MLRQSCSLDPVFRPYWAVVAVPGLAWTHTSACLQGAGGEAFTADEGLTSDGLRLHHGCWFMDASRLVDALRLNGCWLHLNCAKADFQSADVHQVWTNVGHAGHFLWEAFVDVTLRRLGLALGQLGDMLAVVLTVRASFSVCCKPLRQLVCTICPQFVGAWQ